MGWRDLSSPPSCKSPRISGSACFLGKNIHGEKTSKDSLSASLLLSLEKARAWDKSRVCCALLAVPQVLAAALLWPHPAVSVQRVTGFAFASCSHGARAGSVWTFSGFSRCSRSWCELPRRFYRLHMKDRRSKSPLNRLRAGEWTDFITLLCISLVH